MELFVGLMSGTSVDGIDGALLSVGPNCETFSLRHFVSRDFQPEERREILALCHPETAALDQLCRWHFRLGRLYGNVVQQLLHETNTLPDAVTAVGMHGQTVQHLPGEGTLQLGSAGVTANMVGIPVVHDFRSADMAWGGQGAPLVPFFDRCAFSTADKTKAVQNIGGICNVTVVGPGSQSVPAAAFDTGPGNMLMDCFVEHFSGGSLRYDPDGSWAAAGTIAEAPLERLLADPYFALVPPKSTGRESFGMQLVQKLLAEYDLDRNDWLATAAAFTAASIASQYRQFLAPYTAIDELVISGGGAKNPTLVQMIREHTGLPVKLSDVYGVPAQAKEAMAFALLAAAAVRGIPGSVPEATGASRAARLGSIYYPSL